MKQVAKITRISSKRLFKDLRNKSPIFCEDLKITFGIGNLYLKHINGEAKIRQTKDVILRLLMIPLILEIAKEGKLVEIRGKKEDKFLYYRIEKEIDGEIFKIVLSKNNKTGKTSLLSSFVNNKKSSS